MTTVRRLFAGLAVLLGLATATAAQTTEATRTPDAATTPAATGEEDQKTSETSPVLRNGVVTRMRAWAKDHQLIERMNGDVDGWYPRLGGITRGSGFAGGPGYRTGVFDDRLFLDVSGALSTKGYTAVDARARWLQRFGGALELWTEFRYEDFPQEDFFGTGMSTTDDMRTSYDFDSASIQTRAIIRPRAWLRAEASIGFMRPDIGSGTDDNFPSIEERFTDAEAPGLIDQPRYVHTTFSADIDYRDHRGNPASGGFYRAAYGIWNDETLHAYDFHNFDVQVVQFVPIVPDRTHVLSGRIGATYVNNEPGHRVPFYFLAYVGGMDTIRSFREFRFKDENALWVSAEYKWRPRPLLSFTVFADAGETRADWQDVDLRGMRTGYGVGVGLHSDTQTLARFDVGTGGGEGWQFFIKIRPSF